MFFCMWVREKQKQDDRGQSATSSADHAATDLGSLEHVWAAPSRVEVCLMKVASKRTTLSSGNDIKLYLAQHKSLLTFPPPSYGWWWWRANNTLFDHLFDHCLTQSMCNKRWWTSTWTLLQSLISLRKHMGREWQRERPPIHSTTPYLKFHWI